MRRLYLLLATIIFSGALKAQVAENLAVELTDTIQTVPLGITLQWRRLTVDTPTYVIFRKAKAAISFGAPIARLPATASSYTDTNVVSDSNYEYQVWAEGTYLWSTGYIFAGIKSPAIHNKGGLVLLIDSNFVDSCAGAIDTLMNDISGDGWQIFRHNVSRNLLDTSVYAIISHDYNTQSDVKAVLLLGHIAVPYSGGFDTITYPPDGHVPYHDGAWPSDIYYSCMSGGWTDATVNNMLGSYSANWNIPGDGKWDQIPIPSAAVLEVSRIDFYNMPSFAFSEAHLMESYLTRDHKYKMDSLAIAHRALINDNFGYFSGEAFAANGWRNFPPLVGDDSLYAIPFISSLADSSFQWAYGCGGGTFNSASGIGATSDFAANPDNGIFTLLFGSYFGDWNVQDNFLRAPLCASTPALTSCWAGRPNWFFHHMALGENIGYSARLTQNNETALYEPTNYGAGWIHVALMGDLTLRTDYIQPPSDFTVTSSFHAGATLNWVGSPDPAVIGYYVYRADSLYGYYQRLNPAMITATTYTDIYGETGLKYYMVRPVKLQSTPSGTYYNLGVGITDTATVSFNTLQAAAAVASTISVELFPNPAQNDLSVVVTTDVPEMATMYVTDVVGNRFYTTSKPMNCGLNRYVLSICNLTPGIYTLVVEAGGRHVVKKWVKE